MSRLALFLLAVGVGFAIVLVAYAVSRIALAWDSRPRRSLPGNLGEPGDLAMIGGFDGSRTATNQVFVTLTANTTQFSAALGRATRAAADMQRAMDQVKATIGNALYPSLRVMVSDFGYQLWKLNRDREVKLAGLWARYYVRGGLECRSIDDAHQLVREVLTINNLYLAALANAPVLSNPRLSRRERIGLAVAVMQGWVEHHDSPPQSYRWHDLGDTMVKVDAA